MPSIVPVAGGSSWRKFPAIIVGGGPSLKGFNFQRLRRLGISVGCNDAAFHAETDWLFTMDIVWMKERVMQTRFWLTRKQACFAVHPGYPIEQEGIDGVRYIERRTAEGLSEDPRWVFGHNSGFAALNWAFLRGSETICLLGFDMQETEEATHWHSGYPWHGKNYGIGRPSWIHNFNKAAVQLENAGVRVINFSPESKLTCFEKHSLTDIERVLCNSVQS